MFDWRLPSAASVWLALLIFALPLPAQAHAPAGPGQRRPPPLAMGAAFSPAGELWLVALDDKRRLFVQTSADEGRSWREPRVLDTGTDRIAADGETRPKLVFGPAGQAVISYTQLFFKPGAGQIRLLRSDDGGRSFSAAATVHQDRQLISHSLESVAFDARGTLHTLWVDKRDPERLARAAAAALPPARAGASGTGPGRVGPKVDYRGAAIYRNESVDGGKNFGPDIKLADHSCECCRIALAPASDGSLVALWRHVFAPNVRDHAFAALAAPPLAEPVRATFDQWAVEACPHQGPGLAAAQGGGYHAVWFGVRGGEGRVRYGRLDASGAPLGDVRSLPDERAEHASVESAGAQVAITWRSYDGQATRWRAWVSADEGRSFALRELGRATEDNDHALLARRGAEIFALWRTTQGVRVERLVP